MNGILSGFISGYYELQIYRTGYIKYIDENGEEKKGISPAAVDLAFRHSIENGANIVNMSLGKYCKKNEEWYKNKNYYKAIFSNAPSTLFIASAGNDGKDAVSHFPSATPVSNIISVAATDSDDQRSKWFYGIGGSSNYGDTVSVAAPGTAVYTTKREAGYEEFRGTSASAPLVSGLAALLFMLNNFLSPEEIKNIIIDTSDIVNTDKGEMKRINALKAVNEILKKIESNAPPIVFNVSTSGTGIGDGGTGDITITYVLSDADDDFCNITVEYLGGSVGTTWTSATTSGVSFDISPGTDRIITWNSGIDEGGYNSSDYRVRLTPFDGTDTGIAGTSDVFTVNNSPLSNKPPEASITGPSAGDTFSEETEITFTGSGTDPEDGELGGDYLVWTSNRDGEIGRGKNFSISSLSVNNHTIRLTATDYDGAMSTDSIAININSNALDESPWPMYGHDRQHTCRSSYLGPQSNNVKWKILIAPNSWGAPSPTIDMDGTIYIGSRDSLYAINPDATIKWQYKTLGYILSSAVVGDDRTIYFGSNDGYLYGLNQDGSLKWKYLTGEGVASSPVINGDNIYVGSRDGYLYVINKQGLLEWKFKTDWRIESSPAISINGIIYVGTYTEDYNGYLYAIYPDGTLKWKYEVGNYIYHSPSVAEDGTIYIHSSYLHAINPDGSLKWKVYMGIGGTPAIGADGSIYALGSFGTLGKPGLIAINPDGSLKWRYPEQEWQSFSGTMALGGDNTIYVASGGSPSGVSYKAPGLYALNINGSLIWKYEIPVGSCGPNRPGLTIGFNMTLYGIFWDGQLYAFGE